MLISFSNKIEKHVYGFPRTKPKRKEKLLTFISKYTEVVDKTQPWAGCVYGFRIQTHCRDSKVANSRTQLRFLPTVIWHGNCSSGFASRLGTASVFLPDGGGVPATFFFLPCNRGVGLRQFEDQLGA